MTCPIQYTLHKPPGRYWWHAKNSSSQLKGHIPSDFLKKISDEITFCDLTEFLHIKKNKTKPKILFWVKIVFIYLRFEFHTDCSPTFTNWNQLTNLTPLCKNTKNIKMASSSAFKKVSNALGIAYMGLELFKNKMPCTVQLVLAIGRIRPLSSNYIP